MYTNYLIYINSLTQIEKQNHIINILLSLIIVFAILGVVIFLKYKYEDKTKNKFFRNVLERI